MPGFRFCLNSDVVDPAPLTAVVSRPKLRRTVRMSLALFRTGAVLRRSNTRPGRRATFRLNDAMSFGRPTTFAVRLNQPANKADGAARTSVPRAFGVQDVRRLIRTVRRHGTP